LIIFLLVTIIPLHKERSTFIHKQVSSVSHVKQASSAQERKMVNNINKSFIFVILKTCIFKGSNIVCEWITFLLWETNKQHSNLQNTNIHSSNSHKPKTNKMMRLKLNYKKININLFISNLLIN